MLSTSSALPAPWPFPSFTHFALVFLLYVFAVPAPACQARVHHVSFYCVHPISQLWEKCHDKYYIQNDAYSRCVCVAHLQSQSTLHTTHMHDVWCRGNPTNHTRHTCTCSLDAPECGSLVQQVNQKFHYRGSRCTDPSCPLECWCRPMTPCHESCHV